MTLSNLFGYYCCCCCYLLIDEEKKKNSNPLNRINKKCLFVGNQKHKSMKRVCKLVLRQRANRNRNKKSISSFVYSIQKKLNRNLLKDSHLHINDVLLLFERFLSRYLHPFTIFVSKLYMHSRRLKEKQTIHKQNFVCSVYFVFWTFSFCFKRKKYKVAYRITRSKFNCYRFLFLLLLSTEIYCSFFAEYIRIIHFFFEFHWRTR